MNFSVEREGTKTVGTGGWLPPIMRATNHFRIISAFLILLAGGDGTFGDTVITQFTDSELRDAVAAGGTVTFSRSGNILLSGPIIVTNQVLLDGTGAQIQISGNTSNRVFNIETNGILTLKRVSVVDGRATNGGAIHNAGSLALLDCTLERNKAVVSQSSQAPGIQIKAGDAAGGAIYTLGGLIVSNCTFTANVAVGEDGWVDWIIEWGFKESVPAGDGNGGAIYVRNSELLIEIRNTRFLGNQAFGGPGGWLHDSGDFSAGGGAAGGALYVEEGRVLVENCAFFTNSTTSGRSGNYAGGGVSQGGAVYLKAGQLNTWQTRFHQNSAVGAPQNEARGGAVANQAAFSARECFFSGNSAAGSRGSWKQYAGSALGGALYSTSTALLEANTFLTNQILGGDGIWLEGGWGCQAEKAKGGAIYSAGILSMLNNSVISNTSKGGTGGVGMAVIDYLWRVTNGNDGLGGGLYNQGQAYITNCTFAWNKAQGGLGGKPPGLESPKGQDGQALGGGLASEEGTIRLQNTIVADSLSGWNFFGTIADGGHNLSSDSSPGLSAGTSFNSTPALFSDFGYHGGPTPTLPLLPSSPALNHGAAVPGLMQDQRGFPRTVGAATDMGACELQEAEILELRLILADTDISAGRFTLTWVTTNDFRLQKASSLENALWQDVPGSEGTNRLILPMTEPAAFFRLVNVP